MNNDSRSFEDELVEAKADIAVIRSNYATKSDLAELRLDLMGEIHAQGERLQGEIDKQGEQLRGQIYAQGEQLRGEIHAQGDQLRGEIRTQGEQMRGEIQAASALSRSENQTQAERLHGGIEALRGEVYKAINAQTWKLIGTLAAVVTAVHFLARAGY